MNLRVYSSKKQEESAVDKVQAEEAQKPCYETPKLIRENGTYYIGYENDRIPIEEWEAAQVYEHPETVYDVIVAHRRKFYFNTAEDSPRSLFDRE